MPEPLTERQNEAYEYIRSHLRTHRRAPTMAELARALGVRSTNAAYKLVDALVVKGHLQRDPHIPRGLSLVDADEDPFATDEGVPSLMLISRTHSAHPERLRKRPAGYLSVDPRLLGDTDDPDAYLVTRAGDDGMNGQGIRKGDYLVVHETDWGTLPNGCLVASLVGERVQARRFDYLNRRLHLHPKARGYTSEAFAPDDPACFIIGRIVGVMRGLGGRHR
ncbi:MAG: S24 family peptidase [Bacteroidota bacterium]